MELVGFYFTCKVWTLIQRYHFCDGIGDDVQMGRMSLNALMFAIFIICIIINVSPTVINLTAAPSYMINVNQAAVNPAPRSVTAIMTVPMDEDEFLCSHFLWNKTDLGIIRIEVPNVYCHDGFHYIGCTCLNYELEIDTMLQADACNDNEE